MLFGGCHLCRFFSINNVDYFYECMRASQHAKWQAMLCSMCIFSNVQCSNQCNASFIAHFLNVQSFSWHAPKDDISNMYLLVTTHN